MKFPRGFTLIELMVTLLIIGMLAGLVAIKALPDEQQFLLQEAQKLGLLLEQARDEALTSRRTLAWSSRQNRYAFWQLNENREWQPFQQSESLRPRELPGAIAITALSLNQTPLPTNTRLVFSPSGLNPAFSITLTLHQHQVKVTGDGVGAILIQKIS